MTGVALVFFQKDALHLTPAEVAGVASDCYPIFGSRRAAYLLLGALLSLAGYAALATMVHTRETYLAAMLFIAIGYMVQDVVADALSVQVAETQEEIGQIQTLGRMALLVATSVPFIRTSPRAAPAPAPNGDDGPLGGGKGRLVLGAGLGYAAFGVAMELLDVPFGQELVLLVSGTLIALLLHRVDISRAVAIAAIVIFMFRATPSVGQGYSYWAIDELGFDQKFLGLLAQVSSVLSLAGLLIFRKTIVKRPVSFTLFAASWPATRST